jgi:hypothetical protein
MIARAYRPVTVRDVNLIEPIEVIRAASARSPKDAAFFLLFHTKIGNIFGDLKSNLELSKSGMDADTLSAAVRSAMDLGDYCESGSGDAEYSNVREKFPGFSDETYTLARRFSANKEIKRALDKDRAKARLFYMKAAPCVAVLLGLLKLALHYYSQR